MFLHCHSQYNSYPRCLLALFCLLQTQKKFNLSSHSDCMWISGPATQNLTNPEMRYEILRWVIYHQSLHALSCKKWPLVNWNVGFYHFYGQYYFRWLNNSACVDLHLVFSGSVIQSRLTPHLFKLLNKRFCVHITRCPSIQSVYSGRWKYRRTLFANSQLIVTILSGFQTDKSELFSMNKQKLPQWRMILNSRCDDHQFCI